MILICMRTENNFCINGFALSLTLKQGLGATQKHREPTQQTESSFLISMDGGAWPFLVGGVICLVNSVNERGGL